MPSSSNPNPITDSGVQFRDRSILDVPNDIGLARAFARGVPVENGREKAKATIADFNKIISSVDGTMVDKIELGLFEDGYIENTYTNVRYFHCTVYLKDGTVLNCRIFYDLDKERGMQENCHAYTAYEIFGWEDIKDEKYQAILHSLWIDSSSADAFFKKTSTEVLTLDKPDIGSIKNFIHGDKTETGSYYVLSYERRQAQTSLSLAHSGILEIRDSKGSQKMFIYRDSPGFQPGTERSLDAVEELWNRYVRDGMKMKKLVIRKVHKPARK